MNAKEASILDANWDELNRSGASSDSLLNNLGETVTTPGPDMAFADGLRRSLLAEALATTAAPDRQEPSVEPVGRLPVETYLVRNRLTQPNQAVKWLSLLAAGLLIFLMIAGIYRQAIDTTPTEPSLVSAPNPATPTDTSIDFDDVLTANADNQRTNMQPGPIPTGNIGITNHADVSGTSMILVSKRLIVSGGDKVTALNAETLEVIWQYTTNQGMFGSLVASGDMVLVGVNHRPEVSPVSSDDQQLIALSVQDGSEIWRIDSSTGYESQPVIQNDTVYALGGLDDQSTFGAYRLSDGSSIWSIDLPAGAICCGGGSFALDELHAYLTFEKIAMAIYLKDGQTVWSTDVPMGQVFGHGSIIDTVDGANLVVPSNGIPEMDGTRPPGQLNYIDITDGRIWYAVKRIDVRIAGYPGDGGTAVVGLGFSSPDPGTSLYMWSSFNINQTGPFTLQSPDKRYEVIVDPVSIGTRVVSVLSEPSLNSGNPPMSVLQISRPYLLAEQMSPTEQSVTFPGRALTEPIVSGKRIFVLTDDAGLYVIGTRPEGPAATSTETITFTDVPMDAVDPLRSNNMPGPAPQAAPAIVASNPEIGWGGMILVDGQLLVSGFGTVSALDPESLEVVWLYNSPGPFRFGSIAAAAGVVVVGGTHEYGGSSGPDNGVLMALRISDGTVLWQVKDGGSADSQIIINDGIVYSVSIGGSDGSGTYSQFQLADGLILNQVPLDGIRWCCDAVSMAMFDGITVLVSQGRMIAIDQLGGHLIWTASAPNEEEFGRPVITPPVFVDGGNFGPQVVVNSHAIGYPREFEGNPFGQTWYYMLHTGQLDVTLDGRMAMLATIDGVPGTNVISVGVGSPDSVNSVHMWNNGSVLHNQATDIAITFLPAPYTGYQMAPIAPGVVDGMVYVVTESTAPSGSSPGLSRLTAVSGYPGDPVWTVEITGSVSVTPIISGGSVFILTSDAGIFRLSDKP